MKVQILQVLFKDRGMVMAVTKAKEQGKKLLSVHLLVIHRLCISMTSGLKAIVVIPEVRLHSVNYRKSLCMV